MTVPFVAILMGSDSDLPVMQATITILKQFDINHEVRVRSAHRTPEQQKLMLKMLKNEAVKYSFVQQV